MNKGLWLTRLRAEGFNDGHIQLLKGTNKSVAIEVGWYYTPWGFDSKFKTDKPRMRKSTLTNYYINGKNHWSYSADSAGIVELTYFTGENLKDFKLALYEVIDTINHPEFQEYHKKFENQEHLAYVALEDVNKEYLRIGNFAAKREGSSIILFTFEDGSNNVDQFIHIGAERIHLFKDWFEKVMLKK